MIIIKVDKGIENALKKYKYKHRKLKISEKLREKKYFTKKSVKRRKEIMKAAYIEKKYGDSSK